VDARVHCCSPRGHRFAFGFVKQGYGGRLVRRRKRSRGGLSQQFRSQTWCSVLACLWISDGLQQTVATQLSRPFFRMFLFLETNYKHRYSYIYMSTHIYINIQLCKYTHVHLVPMPAFARGFAGGQGLLQKKKS
jgi:hypothetical protein